MKLKASIFVLLTFLLLVSCVPNKDLIYLQDKGNQENLTNAQIQLNQKPYKLQVGDLISIDIKSDKPELVAMFKKKETTNIAENPQSLYFSGYNVDIHGNIRIPKIGELNVLGYTVDEVSDRIKAKLLEEYFNDIANIFVTVKLAGLTFTVNGEVGDTGSFTLYKERVTILEAIANAGDITVVGNRKDVLVIRQYPQGQKIHHIDLTDISAMQSPYYYVLPNDLIYVKPLKQKSLGTGTTLVQTLTTVISVLSLVARVVVLSRNL
jgi:polysaccharide export outer membrane protein